MTEPYADDAAVRAAMSLPFPADEAATVSPTLTPTPDPEPEPDANKGDLYEEAIPEFDPRWRQEFTGLLYIGALTETFTLYGHKFTIATPTQTEFLQIGLVIAPYQNTVMGEAAYEMARVAAYLVAVDGKALPKPITNDPKESALQQRFEWVTDTLKRELVHPIFEKCLEMDAKVEGVLTAMGKASG